MNAVRAVKFSRGVGVVLMVMSCSSGYYGVEQEVDDFDRGAYETARIERGEHWATVDARYDQDLTVEAEIWADMVATQTAIAR